MTSLPSCSCSVTPDSNLVIEHPQLVTSTADLSQPTVGHVKVTQSSGVHIGPKYVSVTEYIQNIEVTTDRILSPELPPRPAKRLRCSIAVFVCWALAIALILTFFIFYFALYNKDRRLRLDINHSWYLPRETWHANADRGIEFLELPVRYVLIGHSATQTCTEKHDCIKIVMTIQKNHQMEYRWKDIGPNFLVGGDGLVFEGRGANVVSVMVLSWNFNSISIMFLGNYGIDRPTKAQFHNIRVLLQNLVRERVLTADYEVYGHCQIKGGVESPGQYVMDDLFLLDHWNPVNKTACVRKGDMKI